MFSNVSDEQLQSEIKRRKEERKGAPLWVRQPAWWKVFDLFMDFLVALFLVLSSPIWVPFWLTHRVHQWSQKELKESAEDWKKYHG